MWIVKLIKIKCLIKKKIFSNSFESNVVKILLGNYIFFFLFNWCDNFICLVDVVGSYI